MQAGADRKLVLVVEDDPWTRTTEAALLAGEGYPVAEAKDGHEALRLAASLKPSVILLDLALPTMSGLDVLRALRANPATRDIGVVIVSAYSSEVTDADAKLADARVSKPFGYDELVQQVDLAAGRQLAIAG
jgi:CheY-like chemotaxis protein